MTPQTPDPVNRTLVTGGTGFIGTHVVRALVERGDHVRVLVLPDEDVWMLDDCEIEVVRGDVRSYASVLAAMQGCTTVYHISGVAHLWAPDPSIFEAVNHQGTLNVIRAVQALPGVERVIYTSSATVLEPEPDENGYYRYLRSEKDAAGPYCRSKLAAGRAILQSAHEGLPAVILCPTAPLGPGDHNLTPPTRMILDFLTGKIKGAIYDCRFNVVDVRDVATAHIAAETSGEPGRIYVVNGVNTTLSALLGRVAAMTGLERPSGRVSYLTAVAFGWLSELWARYVTGQPPTADLTGVRLARRTPWFDGGPAARTLDLSLRSLNETLYDAIQDLIDRELVQESFELRELDEIPAADITSQAAAEPSTDI